MTLLEIVNTVLVKLRQKKVASITENEYSTLIAQLANEARREVEDAWNWLVLRNTVSVVTVAGSSQYVLTGVGNSRFKVLDVINDTDDTLLTNANSSELTKKFLFGDVAEGSPAYFGFNGFDSNGDPVVDIYPIPDNVYQIRFNLVIPQNDITTGSVQVKVPGNLVYLGTYVKALVERGEDGSSAYEVATVNYTGALSSAISQEDALMPGETVWTAV